MKGILCRIVSVVTPLSLLLMAAMSVSLASAAGVAIPDTYLKTALLERLGRSSGDITDADLKSFVRLDISSEYIHDLTGLEKATNLTELTLSNNYVSDYRPLSALTGLKKLNAAYNKASDLSPLASLTGLTHLDVSGTYNMGSIQPLKNLTNLVYLNLQMNNIKDIQALASLTKLQSVYLSYNKIQSLSPLSQLTSLRSLGLGYNELKDVSSLGGLTRLETLALNGNELTSLDAVGKLIRLKNLNLQCNRIDDVSPIAKFTRLMRLDISYNYLDINYGTQARTLGERVTGAGGTAIVEPQVDDGLPTPVLGESILRLGTGESQTVKVTVSSGANVALTWSSSNTAIATVSASGVVKGVSPGTAVVKCTADNGKAASVEVRVYGCHILRDELNNFDHLDSRDIIWKSDAMGTDKAIARITNKAASIVYKAEDLRDFKVRSYGYTYGDGFMTAINAYVSADGKAWTAVRLNEDGSYTPSTHLPNEFAYKSYWPAELVMAGMNYLKVEIPVLMKEDGSAFGEEDAWRTLLGAVELYYGEEGYDEADRIAAAKVVALIDAIGTVNKNSEAAIVVARREYNALTDNGRRFVANYDKLLKAEETFRSLYGELDGVYPEWSGTEIVNNAKQNTSNTVWNVITGIAFPVMAGLLVVAGAFLVWFFKKRKIPNHS